MKVYQVTGYPKNHYFVRDSRDFLKMMIWMNDNDVVYLHESSSIHGYGFSIKKNFEWFSLKWL